MIKKINEPWEHNRVKLWLTLSRNQRLKSCSLSRRAKWLESQNTWGDSMTDLITLVMVL